MLKHVGHHRSTSSMARTSISSKGSRSSIKKRRDDISPPKIIRTQDDSVLHYETTFAREVLVSSPEFFRRNMSSPESCSSELGSPEVLRRFHKSGRSQSLQSSPVAKKKFLGVPQAFECPTLKQDFLDVPSKSFNQDLLEVPSPFKDSPTGHESDEEPVHSSPEIIKRDFTADRPSTLPRRGAQRALDMYSMRGPEGVRKRSADSCSLSSSVTSYSSFQTGRLTSRASSTSSLADVTVTPVKVYLRFMRPDIEYKTLRLSTATTCRQLIILLLAKFRLRHRDPNLFFVRMEITVRSPGVGAPTRRLLVLDDQARPAELQQCRPRGDARFSVGVRRGGLLRIHDSILMPGSQYKSLLVSYRTTSEELIQLLLNCYNNREDPRHFAIHELNRNPYNDRQLRHDDLPLLIQSEWPRHARQNYAFILRRNANYALSLKARISWRHSIDHSGTDTESEHEDHFSAKRKPRAPSLPVSHMHSCRVLAAGPSHRASNASTATTTSSLSPLMSRVSCDSGFSSPSSSSRSSTASTGSPSPPGSPSLSTSLKPKGDSRSYKTSTPSVSALCRSSLAAASVGASSRIIHNRQSVTVTVSQVGSSTGALLDPTASTSSSSSSSSYQRREEKQTATLSASPPATATCILTIPLSPIPVPISPPPLTVLSSSVVATLSPEPSPLYVTREYFSSPPSAKARPKQSSSSRVSLRTSPIHTTYFYTSDPPSSLCVPLEGTLIPPSSAPPSPSSPPQTRRRPLPPSPSAPTSPCRSPSSPPSLQSTIITIPSSGPSVVSSSTFSASAQAGMRELTAALESLRTLTIKCPNYDNCFYI